MLDSRGRGRKRHALNFCPNFLFAGSKEREREIRKGVREVAEIEDVDTLHNRLRYDILIHMCVFSVYHSNTCRIAASCRKRSAFDIELMKLQILNDHPGRKMIQFLGRGPSQR